MRCRHATRLSRLVLAAGLPIACSASAFGQTWDGGGLDNNWTNALNWNPDVAPLNNGTANIIFAGTIDPTPIVNIAQDVNGITFSNTAGAFAVGGAGPLTIRAGGITNNDTQTQSFNVPVVAAGFPTWASPAGALLFFSPITLNTDVTFNTTQTIQFESSAPISGPGGITKLGAGSLAIGAACSYAGPTVISAGALIIQISNAIPDASPVSVAAGATLNVAVPDTLGSLTGSGSVVIPNLSTLTISSASGSSTWNGSTSGAGSLVKAGGSTVILGGSNGHTGATTVSGGTLRIAASERLDNSSDLTLNGGAFDLGTFTETVDQFTMSSSSQLLGGGEFGTGTLIANSVVIEGFTISARIAGNTSLIKNNPITNAVFTGTGSSYTGATNITGGQLVVNAPNVIPDTSTVNVTSPGEFRLINFNDTIAGLVGNGTVNVINATLTIGAGNASGAFVGVIGDTGVTGNLTKIGSGSLTLNGACTYRGVTTLNAGNLTLGAAERLDDASDLVVNAGQFITVNEAIDQCTLNGGEIRPNIIGVGSLRANLFTFNSGYCDAILAAGGLVKGTNGLVTLAAANSHVFTRIDAGVLSVPSAAALGAPGASVLLNGGTLQCTAPMIVQQPVIVAAPSFIDCQGDVILSNFSQGVLSQALTKIGPGTLAFGAGIPSLTALSVNAGVVYLGPTALHSGGTLSIAAAGTYHADGALTVLTGSVTNAGRIILANGARLAALTLTNTGVIEGSGRISAGVSNGASGDIRIAEGESIHFASASALSNAGLIEIIGGVAEFDGALTNAANTGLIYARDAALRFDAGLTNLGGVALSFGVTDVFGDIDNRAGGVITISGGSDATFIDDVVNNGTLRTSVASAAVFLGALSGAGTFPGTGTVYMEGDLRPGNSPGTMRFGGDLVVGSFARVQAEIAGTSVGQFDRVIVDGTATLDGTLEVVLLPGYRPGTCDRVTILSARTLVGTFSRVNLPRNVHVEYAANRVDLLITGCPADLDDGSGTGTPDCGVTVDDLLYFLDGYQAGLLRADLDDGSGTGTPDGGVTVDDLLYFLDRYDGGC